MTTEATKTGGSLLTENAGDETTKTDVQTSGQGNKGGSTEPTAEQKAQAAKLEADKAAKAALEAAVDEKWNPKLSDGQKLDDDSLKGFRDLAKQHGFKAGQAQALVEFDLARAAAADKAATEAFQKTREGWREAIKKDPELGGANHEKSLRAVQRAMARFGTSAEFKKFADAGAGDHPEFVRFVAAVGASLGEDPGVKSTVKTNGTAATEDAELRKMFPNSPELFT